MTKLGRKPRPIHERFWEKAPSRSPWPDHCWLWTSAKDDDGYGRFTVAGRGSVAAHKVSWTLTGSEIPNGMELDHACRNRLCVRPEHLSLVEPGFNGMQGVKTSAAKRRAQTRCKRDHEFTDSNTYWHNNMRFCRTCRREAQAARRGKA